MEEQKWPIIGMTVEETAAALRIAPYTVRMLIKNEGLPARKLGKGYRIDPDAVKAWLARGIGEDMGQQEE